MKFDPHFIKVLGQPEFEEFTFYDVLELYSNRRRLGEKNAERWIFCQIRFLIQAGMLKQTLLDQSNQIGYIRTNTFDVNILECHQSKEELGKDIDLCSESQSSMADDIYRRRLNLQIEKFIALGEAEEYRYMFPTLGKFQGLIEHVHDSAERKAADLIGRIKALENISELISTRY